MREFLVWGAGGHGRVVADLIRATGDRVAGFIDGHTGSLESGDVGSDDPARIQQADFLTDIDNHCADIDGVVVAIGDNRRRMECLRLLHRFAAPPLVHPAAVLSPSARTGPGTVVMASVVLNPAAVLGAGVIANTACVIEHDCLVGDGAHISPGAVLLGGVIVEPLAWVGGGATVLPGVRIGAGAMVGAGAVVIRDVPDGETVVGTPARALVRESVSK